MSTLCLIQIQFSKSFQVQLQAAAVFRQHRTKSVWRLCTQSACRFSVILPRNPLPYGSMPAEFLRNLPKNLTTHLTHKLCAVLPLGYGVPLCYNIPPSPNRITITSSSEIASMLHGTYPRRYVFSSSLSIACCMRLVSFSDLLL